MLYIIALTDFTDFIGAVCSSVFLPHRQFTIYNFNICRDPLVQAADMTGMDLGSLLSDLVAAKKRMREKKGKSVQYSHCLSMLFRISLLLL